MTYRASVATKISNSAKVPGAPFYNQSTFMSTVKKPTIFRDAQGNMVRTQSGKRVVIQGLSDYIVVEKEDVLLICPKQDEQDKAARFHI